MPPYNAYQYYPVDRPRIINWPKMILWTLGILVLAAIVVFFIMDPLSLISDKVRDIYAGGPGIAYDCSSDIYNCDNFTIQSEAQAVFDYCGPGDVHQLDGDGNGRACEGLN